MIGDCRIRAALIAALLLVPADAMAQRSEPIGPFAADLRGIFARHKQEPSVATELGVQPTNLPSRSYGFTAGAQWYPWPTRTVTLGFGGHLLSGRGSHTLEPTTPTGSTSGTPTTAVASTVVRHFSAYAADLSLNFGHRNGWSYISGGLGRSRLFVERKDQPVSNPPGRQMIHYGGGARWFTNRHIAVSLDFRWYSIGPQETTAAGAVAQPRTTLLVLSGGIALR
jgi:hypothetical protein